MEDKKKVSLIDTVLLTVGSILANDPIVSSTIIGVILAVIVGYWLYNVRKRTPDRNQVIRT